MIMSVPAFAQLSDKTGLNSRMYVDAGGQEFEILTTANFQVSDADFDLVSKTLRLSIISSLENNFGEITIPKTLLGGQLNLVLNGDKQSAKIRSNDNIWFITIEFNGTNTHTLEIIGTESISTNNTSNTADDNGCLIATAAYGSELSSQVQLLREIRDDIILETESGTAFMNSFNQFYYSFSPTIADWQRQNHIFKEAVKMTITPLVSSLAILNYVDINSESEMLGYGIGIVMINAGMYFAPVVGISIFRKYMSFH